MKKLIFLALCASSAALCQNPPASLPSSMVVSNSAPAGSFSINANGDVQLGQNQTLSMFELSAGNVVYSDNLDSNAGNFKRHITGTADAIQFAAGDIFLRTFTTGSAGSTAAPLTAFQIKNGAPDGSMLEDASGNLTIKTLKSTTGTRYVCVDTTGKLISSATACSGT